MWIKNNLYFNNIITCYELKILLTILLLKLPRVSVSLINLGKELKILAPQKAKALCPVTSLHLGKKMSDWFTVNKLQFHPLKLTKLMVVGSTYNLNTKSGDLSNVISIDNNLVSRLPSNKCLEVLLDEKGRKAYIWNSY